MEIIYMIIGFSLASYAIVANDSIQTLGTFLSSNSEKKWWMLWLFAGGILSVTLLYGWYAYDGDVSYGRLSRIPHPTITWIHIIPPLALLLLTRFGFPVSTTFLVLSLFAQKSLDSMILKSLSGYVLAFGAGFLIYFVFKKLYEKFFIDKESEPPKKGWYYAQLVSTGFLWSQWLIQDLANIYVYLPRKLGLSEVLATLLVMLLIQAVILYNRGGKIQRVVTTKSSTQNIRSATLIDLIYAFILLYFKQLNNIPMSTTWVFLGLLGGRELAITTFIHMKSSKKVLPVILGDLAKATVGLVLSVAISLGLTVFKTSEKSKNTTENAQLSKEKSLSLANESNSSKN